MLTFFKQLFRKEKFQFLPIEQVGKWRLEMNRPWGFVVRNLDLPSHEYHFMFQSSGWITSRCFRNKHNKKGDIRVLNAYGTLGGNPFLVDRENCALYARVTELQKKSKKTELSPEEMKELLKLSGVLAGG